MFAEMLSPGDHFMLKLLFIMKTFLSACAPHIIIVTEIIEAISWNEMGKSKQTTYLIFIFHPFTSAYFVSPAFDEIYGDIRISRMSANANRCTVCMLVSRRCKHASVCVCECVCAFAIILLYRRSVIMWKILIKQKNTEMKIMCTFNFGSVTF